MCVGGLVDVRVWMVGGSGAQGPWVTDLNLNSITPIEEYSSKRGLSPIWFISRKMAKRDFVYHCWQWLAVTLKWLLHMLWISHHYETFTECRNEDSVAEIDTNSIFMIWWLNRRFRTILFNWELTSKSSHLTIFSLTNFDIAIAVYFLGNMTKG